MTRDRRDALLERDWADAWESLSEAAPLVQRPKTAQITLRLPAPVIARIRRVADTRALPYHALTRSWIADGLRQPEPADAGVPLDEPQTEQLNIKLDNAVLDELKSHAHELRRPYHRLAREWIEAALSREEESLGLDSAPSRQPAIKDLMVLLLHATDKSGRNVVHGITRLQKLLFVVEQSLASQSRFYAFNYGPFNEEVNDTARALRLAGFLQGTPAVAAQRPSFAQMMATVAERAGPRDQTDIEEFALNDQGHEAAESLRHSNPLFDRLYEVVKELREEWDTSDLLERVYERWPKYTERSLIRKKVEQRTANRRTHRP